MIICPVSMRRDTQNGPNIGFQNTFAPLKKVE
jgi:hypothetical protein